MSTSAFTVEQVTELVGQGMTDAEIGAHFGKIRQTVQTFRKKHGIPPAGPVGRNARWAEPAPQTDSSPPRKLTSLDEFLMQKKRAACPVCNIKEPVRTMVLEAKKKGHRQSDIIEWLQACHRITITPQDLTAHANQRHLP